jgi:hypothetical protein
MTSCLLLGMEVMGSMGLKAMARMLLRVSLTFSAGL